MGRERSTEVVGWVTVKRKDKGGLVQKKSFPAPPPTPVHSNFELSWSNKQSQACTVNSLIKKPTLQSITEFVKQ